MCLQQGVHIGVIAFVYIECVSFVEAENKNTLAPPLKIIT